MKTMKKLFAICLVLFAMFTLASCVEEQQPDCEHEPGSWAVSETEHWKVCGLCNEEVEKGEHTFGEFEVIIEPSVGVPGVQARKCEECKYVDRQEIPAIEVETGVAEADFTVFAKVPAGWEKSFCYFWSETGAISSEHTVGWPGKEMTLVDAEQNIWAFIVPAGTDHVIFNNGAGVQTVDIVFATKLNLYVLADEAGADGKFTSLIEAYESSFEGEINKYPTNAAETFKTIYVQLPLTWVGHNIHYWGSAAGSTWPGDPLEAVDAEKGLYKFELSSTVTGFLFGEGDGLAQTGDLAPEEGVDGYIVEVVDGVVTVTNCKYVEGELQPITTYTVYAQLPE